LLNKRYEYLSDEQKQQVDMMLYVSDKLSTAYWLKEGFLKILDCHGRNSAREQLSHWVMAASNSDIKRFEDCAKTMVNWSDGILNSFECHYTNGFTEGCNNKIKVLKRNAYGYRNFHRFRNRILHIFNHNINEVA
jgi:transposase